MRKLALTLTMTIYAIFSPFLVLNIVSETPYANASQTVENLDDTCRPN